MFGPSQVPICRISRGSFFLKRRVFIHLNSSVFGRRVLNLGSLKSVSPWDLLRNATKSSSERAQWSTRHGWAQWPDMRKEHHACGPREGEREGRRAKWRGREKEERSSKKGAVTIAASITRSDAHGLFQYYAPWQVSQTARRSTYSDSICLVIEFSVSDENAFHDAREEDRAFALRPKKSPSMCD